MAGFGGGMARAALGRCVRADALDRWCGEAGLTGGLGNGEEAKTLVCFERMLRSDLREIAPASGSLPSDLPTRKDGRLEGLHVLQVDEMWDCAAPAKHRFTAAAAQGGDAGGAPRLLKMHVTDGITDVVALEYRRMPGLRDDAPAGTKIVVNDAIIRGGMLLLGGDTAFPIGGGVRALQEANARKLAHWNKVVGGQLGIKKAQCFDTLAKLQSSARAAALGLPPSEAPGMRQPPPQQQQQQHRPAEAAPAAASAIGMRGAGGTSAPPPPARTVIEIDVEASGREPPFASLDPLGSHSRSRSNSLHDPSPCIDIPFQTMSAPTTTPSARPSIGRSPLLTSPCPTPCPVLMLLCDVTPSPSHAGGGGGEKGQAKGGGEGGGKREWAGLACRRGCVRAWPDAR